jgi:hypothetical protein
VRATGITNKRLCERERQTIADEPRRIEIKIEPWEMGHRRLRWQQPVHKQRGIRCKGVKRYTGFARKRTNRCAPERLEMCAAAERRPKIAR